MYDQIRRDVPCEASLQLITLCSTNFANRRYAITVAPTCQAVPMTPLKQAMLTLTINWVWPLFDFPNEVPVDDCMDVSPQLSHMVPRVQQSDQTK